jgi:Protein of unknown function (DUF1579)
MLTLDRRFLLAVLALIVAAPLTLTRADNPAADYTRIREGISKLAPLVGKWRAVALFYDGDKITENDGTYDIRWALEETYLEFREELHRRNDPSHHHELVLYVTYNPSNRQYDSTYFYSRWAIRVTETGEYDAVAREFRTKAFIPLEDGVHDENVRTITNLKDPNKIVYTHYSRYSNQARERMDVEITLTREQ